MTAGKEPALTIYTDASYLKGKGGWGAVLVWADDDHETHRGNFKTECPSSTAGELWAIVNALYVARKRGRNAARITVYTDCASILKIVWQIPQRGRAKRKWFEPVSAFHDALARLGVPVEVKWCPGH